MADPNTAAWLPSFLTAADSLAAVSWVGLLVTVTGFAVALYQLSKIKTASEASASAVRQVLSLVRERMNLTELVSAVGYVDSIKSYIVASNHDSAIIYIDLLRSKLIYLREMFLRDDKDSEEIGGLLVNLALISEQLRRPAAGREEIRKLLSAFVPIGDMLQRQIARLRFTPLNISSAE
jgi:hypothetical protein